MNHKLDTDKQVFFYEQDFYVLSNFSAFRVKWQGIDFDTSEHAYHWEKFRDHPDAWNAAGSIAEQVRRAPSAHAAFKLAEGCKPRRRPDWDDVKVEIMRGILKAKVDQHEYVRRKLLETGTRELVEDSWRDDFWGWGPNKDGKNMLGRLWMEIREELRAAHQCCVAASRRAFHTIFRIAGYREDGCNVAFVKKPDDGRATANFPCDDMGTPV